MLRRAPLELHVDLLRVSKSGLVVRRDAHSHAESLVLRRVERNDTLADVVVPPPPGLVVVVPPPPGLVVVVFVPLVVTIFLDIADNILERQKEKEEQSKIPKLKRKE